MNKTQGIIYDNVENGYNRKRKMVLLENVFLDCIQETRTYVGSYLTVNIWIPLSLGFNERL